jgi:hypothetical protein
LRRQTRRSLSRRGDLRDLDVVARLRADVVGAGEQDDDLRIDAVELAVLEAPEDVLRAVGAPPKFAAFQP